MKPPRAFNKLQRLRKPAEDPEQTLNYTSQDHVSILHERVETTNGSGIIRPNVSRLKEANYYKAFSGEGDETPPIVLVIIILSLTFISIIAYFISQMPAKT